ncbi:MAG TPA: glycosyltransferase [Gemmataceae bacterium]|nr:glycosyltransferase [Gemmataceae bacterium]
MKSRTSKKTVCQVVHSLRVGGAELLVANLSRQLSSQFHFVFACLDELGTIGNQLIQEGHKVEVFSRRPGLDWRCSLQLARFLRANRVSLIHAHQYTPFFYGVAARFTYSHPAILFTEHGRHFPDYPRRKRILFNRLALTKRDRAVGVGQAVRQALIDNEGIRPGSVSVIYNGIDLQPYQNGSPDRSLVRKEMGIEPGEFAIILVARMDYLKDHATAIRTLANLRARTVNAKLILVGEGPELGKVEEQTRTLGMSGDVRFLGLRNDVPRLLSAVDLFLLTSISEGIPLTVIEAMAAGLPVVGTRVGGMAEVVEEGKTGLLAPSGDDAGLADHVERLALDPNLGSQMGACGKERAYSSFSLERMATQYRQMYQEQMKD